MTDESGATLAFPGKTFLVGEYLALAGGPSLVLTTTPCFELVIRPRPPRAISEPHAPSPFAPRSPAGRFLAAHPELTQRYQFSFTDPHRGLGGLGASTAQFAGVWVFAHGVRSVSPDSFAWAKLLADYRSHAWSGEGSPPSGADLVAQLTGGVTWFDGCENKVEKLCWNFSDLGFTLIRTGQKVATHEHLKSLAGGAVVQTSKAALHDELRPMVEAATKALKESDADRLVQSVHGVERSLRVAGVTAPTTMALLDALSSQSGIVRAAKGCGAMGADVVLVLHEKSKKAELLDWVRRRGLRTCGSSEEIKWD